jgi:hypothetical protein
VPDERGVPTIAGLVELLYRADWSRLSAAADVTEFDDYDVRQRITESRRPSWAPPPGPGRPARHGPARRWEAAADEDDQGEDDRDEDDEEPDEGQPWPEREAAYRLLIAPGGRFRRMRRSGLGSTGPTPSEPAPTGPADEDGGERSPADDDENPASPRERSSWETGPPPCAELLCPAWLPASFELELAGSAFIAARRAYRIIGRPRPASRGGASRGRTRRGRSALRPDRPSILGLESIDRIDAYVDAELGILLRSERLFRGQVAGRCEMTSITLEPPDTAAGAGEDQAADTDSPHADGAPPDDDEAGLGAGPQFSGPGWDRVKTAASIGATAMSFAIRHAPHREPPAGSHAGCPPDYPAMSRDTGWPGSPGPDEPVSAQIIRLLYQAGLGRTAFDAELRTWADAAAAAAAFRHMTRNASLSGVSQLADAMNERATTWQGRESVRVGLPDRYRIDYIDGGKASRKSTTEASDGTQRWRVFPGHVTVGAALPLPPAIARLVDPAWLLEWRLTGGAPIIEGGRPGFLIRVSRPYLAPRGRPGLSAPAEAVVDAELGILLRLTQEQGGRPSMQQSLTDLTVRPRSEPGDYRVTIPAGHRVVRDSGTVLDEVELSAPVQTAVQLAVKGLGAAARMGGFLQSLRQRGKNPGP